jgi:hypothetical protein
MNFRGKYMNNVNRKIIYPMFILIFILALVFDGNARSKVNPQDKNKKSEIQRTSLGAFDLQQNTVSNIQFYTTNYGIFGLNVQNNIGGGIWPRGSLNQYIYGGGIWFASMKRFPSTDTLLRKIVEISYNPNNGRSWMLPGRIEDGPTVDQSDATTYRTYFSTDFRADGTPIVIADGPNWPIWDSSTNPEDTIKNNRYFGYYVYEPIGQANSLRNLTQSPKGPAYISGEDIFATFKDTDLSYYDGGENARKPLGYPMKLQFEQTIYSWGFGDYKDFIFLKYNITNTSTDTLWNCWMAPVMDLDIGRLPSPDAANDRVTYYFDDPSLNLAVQWTNAEPASGEKGYGFGYAGFDFLESPAVFRCEEQVDTVINGVNQQVCLMCVDTKDTVIIRNSVPIDTVICTKKLAFPPQNEGFLRKDRKVFDAQYQLGLKTFHNWNIEEDINEDEARYNVLSSGVKDGDNGPGDKRFMMSTGPFTMLPGDTVRVVVGLIMASPATKVDADGSVADMQELVRKVKFAQSVYDNNFKAPKPPDLPIFTKWQPLNNGVIVTWDSTAENSVDLIEGGLSFLGYRLYRARRTDLDTFTVDQNQPSKEYSKGTGPLGWKELAHWQLPTPFYKSVNRAGTNPNDTLMPLIDSLRIVGPVVVGGNIDKKLIKVMRVGRGMILADPETWVTKYLFQTTGYDYPVIMAIDTGFRSQPWGKFYASHSNPGDFPLYHNPFNPNANKHYLLDSVSIGVVTINSAMVSYNPLFYNKQTISLTDTLNIPATNQDTINLLSTIRIINYNGSNEIVMDRMVPYDIQAAMKDTLHVKAVLDSVYSYLRKGFAKDSFPSFENSGLARNGVILPYMDSITNHRTFIDIGDDNKDGVIDFDDDPTKTEKLINNVDYWYKLRAFDEGDYSQGIPTMLNNGDVGNPNVIQTFPLAQAAMKPINFKVTYVDSAKIGGLYNFKLFAINPDRVSQLFAGHELELDFTPAWDYRTISLFNDPHKITSPPPTKNIGWYQRNLILKDLTTNKIIFNANTWLEQTPCSLTYHDMLTEDAASTVLADVSILDTISQKEINFGVPYDNEKFTRTGTFSTGGFIQAGYCYNTGFSPDAYGTLGFSFDYSVEQMAGRYRPDSSSAIISGNATTPVSFINVYSTDKILTSQLIDTTILGIQYFEGFQGGSSSFFSYIGGDIGSFNNGPADYVVEFLPGGTETMNLSWSNGSQTNTFDVPYYNVKVTNTISYKRPGANGQEVDVTYPGEVPHLEIGIDSYHGRNYPDPRNLGLNHNDFIGKYNLSAYGLVDARYAKAFKLSPTTAAPADGPRAGLTQTYLGQQGRYYLTGYSHDGIDTVDFANVFQLSGCFFALDYARKQRRWGNAANDWYLDSIDLASYGPDFKPGDKVLLRTNGGALGLPMPGAKVTFNIDSSVPKLEDYTNAILDQVNIVPNPYYITQEGQKSPYDAKIYFTRLPKTCNIDIYTVSGDLVVSLHHDEYSSPQPDKEGIEVWNLLSRNHQRVQSQTLVALITTPNGAQTVKKFAVIVGGFRNVPQ